MALCRILVVAYPKLMADLELDSDTLNSLDLETAASAEAASPADLLPLTIVDSVLGLRAASVANALAAELEYGRTIDQPEILAVPKPRRGRRPVAILGPRDRTLYRALTNALGESIPTPDRASGSFETFKRAPLAAESQDESAFVLMADVSSCYQYIDHEVVHREIVTRTADPFLAAGIVELLQPLEGNAFGLPQNRASSHRLAELVLSIPERLMRRKGHTIWRYSDDFRVGVADRRNAYEAIDDLSESLRLVGLTLNDEKTLVKSLHSYETWANALDKRLEEFVEEASVDLADFTYEGDLIEPDQREVMAESAGRMIDHWVEEEDQERTQFGPGAVARRQMLNLSIGVLGAIGDVRILPLVARILDSDPSMAPKLASYMELIVAHSEDEFDAEFDKLVSKQELYLGPWQCLWLMEPLKQSSGLTKVQRAWLTAMTVGRSPYVGAASSLVLAIHHDASVDDLVKRFDSLRPAAAPLAVAAMSLQVGGENTLQIDAVLDEDPFLQWVFDEAPKGEVDAND